MHDWNGWIDDMSFERRMRNRETRSLSTYAGWNCKEIFAIDVEQRVDYYQPVSELWYASVELPLIYPTPSLGLPVLCELYAAGVKGSRSPV